MEDDSFYLELLRFARQTRTFKEIGERLGVSGASVQMWMRNGVAHKWRPLLKHTYGAMYKKVQRRVALAEKVS